MSDYFIYYLILTRIETFLIIPFIVSFVLLSGYIIKWLMEKNSMGSKAKKIVKTKLIPYFVFTIIFISLYTLIPSKKEIIAYWAFKEVDKYNKTNKTSKLKFRECIGIVDTSLKKIDLILRK